MRSGALCSAMALALVLGGCAQSGVLELQIQLPPRAATDPGPRFALVQVRRAADHPFEVEWQGDDVEAIPLVDEATHGTDPVRVQISVIGTDPSVDLHVKIRFCSSPGCDSLGEPMPPELWYELGHPFYVGRRTSWAACIDAVPTGVPALDGQTVVDRCQIRGCVRGMSSVTHCEGGGTGAHFCETGSIDEPPRDLTCVGGVPTF